MSSWSCLSHPSGGDGWVGVSADASSELLAVRCLFFPLVALAPVEFLFKSFCFARLSFRLEDLLAGKSGVALARALARAMALPTPSACMSTSEIRAHFASTATMSSVVGTVSASDS